MAVNKGCRIIFGLILILVFSGKTVLSQDLNRQISLTLKDCPLAEGLRIISDSGRINFSYNPQSIPVQKKISLNASHQTIREILDEVLLANGLTYSIIENQVVIKPCSSVSSTYALKKTGSVKSFTIHGYIRDKASGEVLIGANILEGKTGAGTTTNGYGFFSLTLPEGGYTLTISFLGYKTLEVYSSLIQNIRLSAELEEARVEMPEIEVKPVNEATDIEQNKLSDIKISRKMLAQMPGFGGNLDIIRALQAIPGIQTYGDGSANYYVRGGNSDQNLLLIDEAPVYNPSHLFGFYSALAPDAINDVQIFKGDFPSRYGGRLSSVIDVKAKEGNMKHFGFSGNAGPYASYLSVEGPIVKNKASFFISGRISTLNWLSRISSEFKNFDFQFYDVNAKLNWKLNESNRFFLTFYTGNDNFNQVINSSFRTFGIRWNNAAGTFRWNHVFSSRLFSNTTVNYSRYNYYLYISKEQDDYWNSSISNLSFKSDFTWFLNPQNTLKAGIEVSAHNANPGNVRLLNTSNSEVVPEVAKYHSMEYDFYFSNDQMLGKKVKLSYGIRLPVWQDLGPTTLYYYDGSHQVIDTLQIGNNESYAAYLSPEPRLNLLWTFNELAAIQVSYMRNTQFLQILSNSIGPFTSLDVWVPAGPNIPPQKADQFSIGYFRKVFRSKINFSAEVFYKQYYDHLDFKDHANLLYNPLIEGELRFGKAWSYGLELIIRKASGKFTGWAGYTFSRAFIQTEGVNDGLKYPASYDRPHNICLNFSFNDQKHWMLSANWVFMTGGAITTPVGFYYLNGYSIPVYGSKNNDRLPSYHRLDLSATYTFSKPGNKFQHSLTLTLYNAYGKLNPFSVNFNKMIDDQGNIVIPSNLNGGYVRVPTTISVAGMIPSINYQFKF